MKRPGRFPRGRGHFRPPVGRLEGPALMATAGLVAATFASQGFYNSAAIDTSLQAGLTAVAVGRDGTIYAAGAVVPSALLTPGSISGNAIEVPSVLGKADGLDFLMPPITDAKKAKPAGTSTH